ncbi:Something about silencing protein 10 [Trichoplax sp. H2]|nr:Something about silencing protein 10 [Trichoplax sp. H2]|eukprot:RDD44221.1 Something about silencing protein 10 [Trichoplax sp. H2]
MTRNHGLHPAHALSQYDTTTGLSIQYAQITGTVPEQDVSEKGCQPPLTSLSVCFIRRHAKLKRNIDEEEEHSDDQQLTDPDAEDDNYYYNEAEQYYNKEKIPLNADDSNDENFSDQDEDLDMDGLESDEDSDESVSVDGKSKDEDADAEETANNKAWGNKKKPFYHFDDEDNLDESNEEELAEDEEREAMLFQEQQNQGLAEEDFELSDLLSIAREKVAQAAEEEKRQIDFLERIPRDISKLSPKEQLEILVKDAPEIMTLIEDYKEKMEEIGRTLHPLIQFAKCKGLLSSQGISYLETKYQLLLNYCVNVSLYLAMAAHESNSEFDVSLHEHPIISTLLEYRHLIAEMHPLDRAVASEMECLLEEYEKLNVNDIADKGVLEKKRKLEKRQQKSKKLMAEKNIVREPPVNYATSEVPSRSRKNVSEESVNQYIESVLSKNKLRKTRKDSMGLSADSDDATNVLANGFSDDTIDGKRAINYQISKNKGLTPRRKKENRNARVKYRNKFIKAQKKRVSQGVRTVRSANDNYIGEYTGIRSDIIRSVKMN